MLYLHYKLFFFKNQYNFGHKIFENGWDIIMYHPITRKIKIKGFHSFFNCTYNEGYYYNGEHHPFWEVVYCFGGTIGVSFDEKIYRLRKGDIVIYPPNVHHKLWSEEESRINVLVFSFDGSGEGLKELGGAYSCDEELQRRWDEIALNMRECKEYRRTTGYLHYLEKMPNRYQVVANECENNLLLLKERSFSLGHNKNKSARDYERIIRTMRENLGEDLTVDEIGMNCGLSVSTMKNLFRQFNSMGIHEYFLHLKMEESIRLLKSGMTVREAAEQMGFSNQSYFSTVFKRVVGESPAQFKKK